MSESESEARPLPRLDTYEWTVLYDSESWGVSCSDIMSESLQRSHLSSFFAAKFPLRHPPSPDLPLTKSITVLRAGLAKLSHGGLWYRLRHSLRIWTKVRLCLLCFRQETCSAREALLEKWLLYWRTSENQHQEYLRRSVLASPRSPRRGRDSLAHAMTLTPETIKMEVLWELYWLARTQHTRAAAAHQRRLRALLAERQRTVCAVRCPGATLSGSTSQPDAVLRPLVLIDAEIFAAALRPPQFRCEMGVDVTFRDLLRMAQGTDSTQLLELQTSARSQDALGLLCSPTAAFFLASPLCQEPTWFEQRLLEARPLVPPMTWQPAEAERCSPRTMGWPAKKAAPPGEGPASGRAQLQRSYPSPRRIGRVPSIPALPLSLSSPRLQPSTPSLASSRRVKVPRLWISPTREASPRRPSGKAPPELSPPKSSSRATPDPLAPGGSQVKSPPWGLSDSKRWLTPALLQDSPTHLQPCQSPPSRSAPRGSTASIIGGALVTPGGSLRRIHLGWGPRLSQDAGRPAVSPARLPRQDSDVRPEAAGAGEAGRGAETEGEPRSRSPSPPQRLVALRCPQPGPLVYDPTGPKGVGFLTIPCGDRRPSGGAGNGALCGSPYAGPLPLVRGRGCSVSRRLSDLDLHATGT